MLKQHLGETAGSADQKPWTIGYDGWQTNSRAGLSRPRAALMLNSVALTLSPVDTASMTDKSQPRYGEHVVSWTTIWDELNPDPDDAGVPPHGDHEAAEMHRLRGLVMAQAAETEAALGAILKQVDPAVNIERMTAGQLLSTLQQKLSPNAGSNQAIALDFIRQAIRRRNHSVHNTVRVGHSWRSYTTGGGEWVSVISIMGDSEYDEHDLLADLAFQQEATVAAARLLMSLS
ncbi:hypothetical protein ACIGXM_01525 [Kitasatospora sp. NPDC052896]|uniref:hypothetical protein n=1 Tax=Kitasatospora sp. NPDC052896 TaxID=3364061 RepID=UPI0037CA31F3